MGIDGAGASAEEAAVHVIDEGWLDGARSIYGVHCDPKLDVGLIGVRHGAISSASDLLEITLSGPGGHTARPELTVDLVRIAADLVRDLPEQVQREAAVLTAQRIEVLSTKPWQDAQAQREALGKDLASWQADIASLTSDADWPSVDPKFAPMLQTSHQQLQAVWDAFQEALAQTERAAQDATQALPAVPAWADQIRVARGEQAQAAAVPAKPKIDPQVRAQATQAVQAVLQVLEQEVAQGHGKASAGAATALRELVGNSSRVAADFANSESMSATSLSFSASLKVSTLTPGK